MIIYSDTMTVVGTAHLDKYVPKYIGVAVGGCWGGYSPPTFPGVGAKPSHFL